MKSPFWCLCKHKIPLLSVPKDKEEMSTPEKKEEPGNIINPSYDYELIGVTVHTGTADGGHYYAFIRDR